MSSSYTAETEYSNHEYKRNMLFTHNQLAKKSIQMLRRIYQGDGVAKYSIGVDDDGSINPLSEEDFTQSVSNLKIMADIVNGMVFNEAVKTVSTEGEADKYYGDFNVQIVPGRIGYVDIRIAVAGNPDSGKSSTVGSLITGKMDNGSGSARSSVLNHQHEIANKGRTSSISYKMIGFNEKAEYINGNYRSYDPKNITRDAIKIITFIDLCGQRNYISTTTSAMTSTLPDYGMLAVNSNSGISLADTTRDHVELFHAYSIPFFAIMTVIDLTTPERFKETLTVLKRDILKVYGYSAFPIRNIQDVDSALSATMEKFVPIFQISNVTGRGQDLLKYFLSKLNQREQTEKFCLDQGIEVEHLGKYTCMPISHIYRVNGVGIVLSGIIHSGRVHINDTLYLGPDGNGEYHKLKVKSIQMNFESLKEGRVNDHIALSFKGKFPEEITPQKGMVLIGENIPKVASNKCIIQVKINLGTNARLNVGACPSGFIGSRRVCFKIKQITNHLTDFPESDILHQGDQANLECNLTRYVFAMHGTRIIFHEGEMRADGKVINMIAK